MDYRIQYIAAWVVAALGIVTGILAASVAIPMHPSWLTTDVAATAGLISTVCVALAAILPQVHRSPAVREAAYLSAAVGVLPPDLAAMHPEVVDIPPVGSVVAVGVVPPDPVPVVPPTASVPPAG